MKALVLSSGGVDSTTALALAVSDMEGQCNCSVSFLWTEAR